MHPYAENAWLLKLIRKALGRPVTEHQKQTYKRLVAEERELRRLAKADKGF